jgi:putative transposase
LNRGNARAEVFHKPEDYDAFLKLFVNAGERHPIRILGWCLMPNHFHLVLRPDEDGDLGRWMQWLSTAHVRRYHSLYHSSGHVWQGRFKAFPIQADEQPKPPSDERGERLRAVAAQRKKPQSPNGR